VADHSGQFTPGGYVSTVKHTALAGNPQPSDCQSDALPVVLPRQPRLDMG